MQYSPIPDVSNQCLPVFFPSSILCKSSSSSYLHLLRGLNFFLVPPIEAVEILLKSFGSAFFQHDHNILVGGILQILQYIPFLIHLLSPCLFCSPVFSFYRYHGFIIYGLFQVAVSGADYIAEVVPRGWW
jgi:hypothetical protein